MEDTPAQARDERPSRSPAGSAVTAAIAAVGWLEILKVVAIPLVTLILGFVFNAAINRRQTDDQKLRLYTELMGRREESDSALRKDMFNSILGTFLSKDPKLQLSQQLDQEILSLELLAYNFHESLDIGPLFKYVARRIESAIATPDRQLLRRYERMLARLEDVTVAVVDRQLTLLSDAGTVERGDFTLSPPEGSVLPSAERGDADAVSKVSLGVTVTFAHPLEVSPSDTANGRGMSRVCLPLDSTDGSVHHRQFGIEAMEYDRIAREVHVWLKVSKAFDGLAAAEACRSADPNSDDIWEIDTQFWVGVFDLPMIDNTHLTHGERCAVSLTRLSEDTAKIAVSYFPASRASLKEKPYYDDLVHDLIDTVSFSPRGHR